MVNVQTVSIDSKHGDSKHGINTVTHAESIVFARVINIWSQKGFKL